MTELNLIASKGKMMRKILSLFFLTFLLLSCTKSQHDLGAMLPRKALVYMQNTKNLYVIDVAIPLRYQEEHFTGAVNIPYYEMEKRYTEIPSNIPVLIHCRRGVVAPGAYETLKKYRKDIPEIGYIAGAPLFSEYNKWKASQK